MCILSVMAVDINQNICYIQVFECIEDAHQLNTAEQVGLKFGIHVI